MRFRTIVFATAAVLALGGLSAYAAASHGLVTSRLATATSEQALHPDDVNTEVSLTTTQPATNTPTTTQSQTTCETTENAQEAAEGTTEQTATETENETKTESEPAEAAGESDRDEVQTCTPPSAACVAALDALKALLTADRAEDQSEVRPTTEAAEAADRTEDAAEKQAKKTAIQAVRAACGSAEHGD